MLDYLFLMCNLSKHCDVLLKRELPSVCSIVLRGAQYCRCAEYLQSCAEITAVKCLVKYLEVSVLTGSEFWSRNS